MERMNKQSLLGTYFRQQAELLMPDPLVNPAIARLLTDPLPASTMSAPPPLPTPPAPTPVATSLKKSARLPGAPSTLKNRLTSLRPVEQLVVANDKKTARGDMAHPEKKEVDMPAGTDKRAALKALFSTACSLCHLAQTRTKFVFGSGSADAPVMVIGEAPGQDEDEQGLPFVGAAGKLLTTMLAAVNLDRTTDLFITNVLKCHPPENRAPESSEIITCIPLLKRQIDIIQPRAMLLLGRIAAHAVLGISESLASMRSRVFDYNGIPTMVIYHPAALLRNAEYKRPAWEDLQQFQKLLATLGVYGSLRKE
jgi:uracil-DNA glycosylase